MNNIAGRILSFSTSLLFLTSLCVSTTALAQVADSKQQMADSKQQVIDSTQQASQNTTATIVEIAIPAVFVTYGIVSFYSPALQRLDHSTESEMHEDRYELYNKLDDYMQFSPAAVAFGLHAFGIKSTHTCSDMAILYALSLVLNTGIVQTTKSLTHRIRPDGSAYNSFPSGHTSTAFVAAEFLYQEYKDKSIWIGIGGYTMASLIGASRILNDKHWISDVVAGAGVGILSTKLVYYTYPYMKKWFRSKGISKDSSKASFLDNSHAQALLFPSYNNGFVCMNFSKTF